MSYLDLGITPGSCEVQKAGVAKVAAIEVVVMNGSPGDAARHAKMLKSLVERSFR